MTQSGSDLSHADLKADCGNSPIPLPETACLSQVMTWCGQFSTTRLRLIGGEIPTLHLRLTRAIRFLTLAGLA
jgi:hypothetical protein